MIHFDANNGSIFGIGDFDEILKILADNEDWVTPSFVRAIFQLTPNVHKAMRLIEEISRESEEISCDVETEDTKNFFGEPDTIDLYLRDSKSNRTMSIFIRVEDTEKWNIQLTRVSFYNAWAQLSYDTEAVEQAEAKWTSKNKGVTK